MEFVEIYCFVSIFSLFVDNSFNIFWFVEGTILLTGSGVVVGALIEFVVEVSFGTVVGILFGDVFGIEL